MVTTGIELKYLDQNRLGIVVLAEGVCIDDDLVPKYAAVHFLFTLGFVNDFVFVVV